MGQRGQPPFEAGPVEPTSPERPQSLGDPASLQEHDLPPGTRVGSYVTRELRSRGGFATVYRGTHVQTGETVAVKVLHPYLCTSHKILRRFEREVEVMARIQHPDIVHVLEVGEVVRGRPYLVMDWVEGNTLAEELQLRGTFSVAEAVGLIERLCSALAAAHRQGVIHRDLKTSNVMIIQTVDGYDLRLLDFGIAKLADPEDPANPNSGLTSTGERLGSPFYMAPEQILAASVDERTDIYALGIILFELLTGGPPFRADSGVEIGEMHLHTPPPKACELAAVPAAVDAVIQRCLEKNADDRYPMVEALVTALKAAAREVASASGAQDRRMSGGWLQADASRSAGCYIDAQILCDDDDIDDPLLDTLDDILAAARDAIVAGGMSVAMDSGTAILGVAQLPGAAEPARRERSRLLRVALDLAASLRELEPEDGRLRAALTVHVSSASAIDTGEGVRFVGGDLLSVGGWTANHPGGHVVGSAQFLTDLEGEFDLQPVAGQEGRFEVRGALDG